MHKESFLQAHILAPDLVQPLHKAATWHGVRAPVPGSPSTANIDHHPVPTVNDLCDGVQSRLCRQQSCVRFEGQQTLVLESCCSYLPVLAYTLYQSLREGNE
jgi:hypothetical protein